MNKVIRAYWTLLVVGVSISFSVSNAQINSGAWKSTASLNNHNRINSWTNLPALQSDTRQQLDYDGLELYNAATGDFQPYTREHFFYDDNHRVMKRESEWYREESGYWDVQTRINYSYDGQGHPVTQEMLSWNSETQTWVNNQRQDNVWDNRGQIQSETITYWDGINREWFMGSRTEYTMDNDGHELEKIVYGWNTLTSAWTPAMRSSREYDETGKLIQVTGQSWDVLTGAWINNTREDYTYDAHGNASENKQYTWISSSTSWKLSSQYQMEYDGSGSITQSIQSNWSDEADQLVPNNKNINTYDSFGNPEESFYYTWNQSSGSWDDAYYQQYSFNTSYSYNDLILPFSYQSSSLFRYMPVSVSFATWDKASGTYRLQNRNAFQYSDKDVSSLDETSVDPVLVYPNPATRWITIQAGKPFFKANIEILDVQGRVVASKPLLHTDKQIQVDQLDSGLYFYKLYIDGELHTGNILIH